MTLRCFGFLVAAVAAGSCAASPTAPSGQVMTFTGTVPVGSLGPSHDLTMSHDGTVTATLTWTDPEVNLNLQLTPAECGVLCHVFEESARPTGTIEELTHKVQAGGRYSFDVISRTTARSTRYTLQIVVR